MARNTDDLWSIASADVEHETEENLFTSLQTVASQYWPVLASATSKQDFDNRLSILSSSLDEATASVLDEDTEGYYASLRTRLDGAFAHDFDIVRDRRASVTSRYQAQLRREVVADLRREADEATTSDPNFLEGPAEGQSGPPDTGGTEGSDAPYPGELDAHPGLDDSAGPNVLENSSLPTLSSKTAGSLFERRHFQHIADGIKSAPVDDATRKVLANHFATHLAGTNDNFDRNRFLKAATGSRLDFRTAESFSEDERKDLAGKGEAEPDGSFPIRNKEDLEHAKEDIGRAGDKSSDRAWINERAKALGEPGLDKSSANEDSWDTNEVSLWFANDFGLYSASRDASPSDLEELWHEASPNDTVDESNVDWQAVWNDIHSDDDLDDE